MTCERTCERTNHRRRAALGLCLAAWLIAGSAGATTPIDSAAVSPDVDVVLAGSLFRDEHVAVDDLLGLATPDSLPGVPGNAAIDAYHVAPNGDRFVSFDTTVELPGGVRVGPGDVVAWNGSSFSVRFDGAAQGVPPGVSIDAISIDEDLFVLLSFDRTVELSGLVFHDEDVARFAAATGFSYAFVGASEGVPSGLDVDAVHWLTGSGHLALSFDTSGSVGGVDFDDEDLLEFDPSSGSWELLYDGSALHSGWRDGDLEAAYLVPEPSVALQAVAGMLFLRAARARRRQRPSR